MSAWRFHFWIAPAAVWLAAGDALGYAVEFDSLSSIRAKYGPEGIQYYDPDFETGAAIISDDTQMTLFTANGLLLSEGWVGYEAIPGQVEDGA